MRKFFSLLLALVMLLGTTLPTLVIAEGDIAVAEAAADAAQNAAEEAARKAAEEAAKAAEEAAAAEEEAEEAQEEAQEEAPAAEGPAEEEEKQEEEPAAEEPAEEEQPAAEEPVVEEPTAEPADETEAFAEGYALAKKDTKVYTNAALTKKLGTVDEDTVVYATKLSEDKSAVAILIAVDGEAREAWLKAEDTTPLTEAETAEYKQEPADVEKDDIQLKNAAFTAAEAPAEEKVPAEPAEGEAAPAEPTEPIEEEIVTMIPADDDEEEGVETDPVADIEIVDDGEAEPAEGEAIEPAEGEEGEPVEEEGEPVEGEEGEELIEEEPEVPDYEFDEEQLEDIAKGDVDQNEWQLPVDVTEAYMSASGTVIISFSTATGMRASSYKFIDVESGNVLLENVAAKKKSGAIYTGTAAITGFNDGNDYTIKIVPVQAVKNAPPVDAPTATKVIVHLVDSTAWQTTVPVLGNPDQDSEGIKLTWTGADAKYKDDKSAITWKVYPEGGSYEKPVLSGDKWTATVTGLSNGTIKFQVQPTIAFASKYTKDDAEWLDVPEKVLAGKKSSSMAFTVDNGNSSKWYEEVTIVTAQQTAAKTATITFKAGRAADSYNLYQIMDPATGATKLVKSGIKLNKKTGIGSAKATKLAEDETKAQYYYFMIVPVLNKQEADSSNLPWVKVPVYKHAWAKSKPTLEVTQPKDHKVNVNVKLNANIGKVELYVNGSSVGTFDSGKPISYEEKDIPNGKYTYTAYVAKKYYYDIINPDGTTRDEGILSGSINGKASAKKKLTVEHLWALAPTNVHAMQMKSGEIQIRFTVQDVPDNFAKDPNGAYQVTETIKKVKTPVATTLVSYDKVNHVVTLSLGKQEGKHTYQIQAVHPGPSHPIDGSVDKEEGKPVTVKVTVAKETISWKTMPNVYLVEQIAEKDVTIHWQSNDGDATQYIVYEKTAKKKFTELGRVDKAADDNGNKKYEFKVQNVSVDASAKEAGTSHVYVIKAVNGKGLSAYSNELDGTITLYTPEWSPFTLENDPIKKDHNVTIRIRLSKPYLVAAKYTVKAGNDEKTATAADVKEDADGKYLEFTFTNVPGGKNEFIATAFDASGAEGRQDTIELDIMADYLLAPTVTATSTKLGELKVTWEPEAAFAEGTTGEYIVQLTGEDDMIMPADAREYTKSDLKGGKKTVTVIPVEKSTTPLTRGNAGTAEVTVYDLSMIQVKATVKTVTPTQENDILVGISVTDGPDYIYPVNVTITATNGMEAGPFTATLNTADEVELSINPLLDEEPADSEKRTLTRGTWQLTGSASGAWGIETVSVDFGENQQIEIGTKYTYKDGLKYEAIDDYGEEYHLTGMKLLGRDETLTEKPATVIVPEKVDGKTVVVVGEEAFLNDKCLEAIDLPDSIVIIEARAFKDCSNLAKMD